jgi:hypothetical protein
VAWRLLISPRRSERGNALPLYGGSGHGDLNLRIEVTIPGQLTADQKLLYQLATGVIRTLPLGPAPYHLVTVKDTGKIYVSSLQNPKLWVVSQRDLQLVGEIPITGIGHQMALLNTASEAALSPAAGQGGKPGPSSNQDN